ncbi:FIS1 [Symbiodinium sp. KB8]|nr:FIS1 [Symbiodinium sp. KB8]
MALTTGEMSAKELKCALEQEKADFSPQSLRVCECGALQALAFRLTAQAKRRVQEAKRALDDAVSSGEAEAIDNRRLAWATVLLASPDDAEVEKGLGTCLELADSKYVQEEALYRVAVGSWRMGDFEQSKAYLGELLQINPQHRAAVAFIGVYEESMWHR